MNDQFTIPTDGNPEASCAFADRVSAYHDGELSHAEAQQIASHLAGCPACARQLAFSAALSQRFQQAAPPQLSFETRQRLEQIADEAASPRLRIQPPADVRWVRRLTAVAAVLFVVAAGKVVLTSHTTPGRSVVPTPVVTPQTGNPLPRPVIDTAHQPPATNR